MEEYFWFDNDDVIGIIQVEKHTQLSLRGPIMYVEYASSFYSVDTEPTGVSYRYITYEGTKDEWELAEYLSTKTDNKVAFRDYLRSHKVEK